jgi:hypothetical protein
MQMRQVQAKEKCGAAREGNRKSKSHIRAEPARGSPKRQS